LPGEQQGGRQRTQCLPGARRRHGDQHVSYGGRRPPRDGQGLVGVPGSGREGTVPGVPHGGARELRGHPVAASPGSGQEPGRAPHGHAAPTRLGHERGCGHGLQGGHEAGGGHHSHRVPGGGQVRPPRGQGRPRPGSRARGCLGGRAQDPGAAGARPWSGRPRCYPSCRRPASSTLGEPASFTF